MEKHLLEVEEAIEKRIRDFCESKTFDATTYAKAMMKATKTWSKKHPSPPQEDQSSTTADQALALESQLCRNMHQMLALEKQKSKLKKLFRETKKYLQRCKAWLSDKQALCELHMMTLDATQASMKSIYEDTLKRQDAYIQKILDQNNKENRLTADEFPPKTFTQGSGLQALLASVPHDVARKYDELPSHSGPGATLHVLRGLPFRDSFNLSKAPSRNGSKGQDDNDEKIRAEILASGDDEPRSPGGGAGKGGRELIIHTHDDAGSINSALSDPDEDLNASGAALRLGESAKSLGFGDDAPWLVEGGGGGISGENQGKEKSNGKVQSKGAEKSFEKGNTLANGKNSSNGKNGVYSHKEGATTSPTSTALQMAATSPTKK
jgi:hypothetical protein